MKTDKVSEKSNIGVLTFFVLILMCSQAVILYHSWKSVKPFQPVTENQKVFSAHERTVAAEVNELGEPSEMFHDFARGTSTSGAFELDRLISEFKGWFKA